MHQCWRTGRSCRPSYNPDRSRRKISSASSQEVTELVQACRWTELLAYSDRNAVVEHRNGIDISESGIMSKRLIRKRSSQAARAPLFNCVVPSWETVRTLFTRLARFKRQLFLNSGTDLRPGQSLSTPRAARGKASPIEWDRQTPEKIRSPRVPSVSEMTIEVDRTTLRRSAASQAGVDLTLWPGRWTPKVAVI
jgi:hypothetical protein